MISNIPGRITGHYRDDIYVGTHRNIRRPVGQSSDRIKSIPVDIHPNCNDNFLASARELGLKTDFVPMPVNLFQKTPLDSGGGLVDLRIRVTAVRGPDAPEPEKLERTHCLPRTLGTVGPGI